MRRKRASSLAWWTVSETSGRPKDENQRCDAFCGHAQRETHGRIAMAGGQFGGRVVGSVSHLVASTLRAISLSI